MSDRADQLLRELLDATGNLEGFDIRKSSDAAVDRWHEAMNAARAYLNEKPHDAAEPEKPVAWLYTREPIGDGDIPKWSAVARWTETMRKGWTETPLYAAVQQPIAREPVDGLRAGDMTVRGELFALRRDGEMVELFIEDDEFYHLAATFNHYWLHDLSRICEEMRAMILKSAEGEK